MSFLSSHVSRPLVIFRAHPSNPFSTFWAPPFWPWSHCVTFPPHLPRTLHATNAMEHVLLAFVHWQEAPSYEPSGLFGSGPSSAASLGIPTRLKDRIWGYLAMLPEPAT